MCGCRSAVLRECHGESNPVQCHLVPLPSRVPRHAVPLSSTSSRVRLLSSLVTAVDTERLGRSQRRHRRPTGTPTPVAERRCTGQRAAVVDADQRGSAACVHAPVVDDLWTAAGSDELVEASSVDLAVEVHAIVERGRHNLPTVPRRDALSVSTDC